MTDTTRMTDHFGETHKMVPANFDALAKRLQQPGRYDPKVAKVLSTPAHWRPLMTDYQTTVKLFCRKGDLIRLLVPTISAWQGIGIAAEKVYDDGDPDTVVPFFKQDRPLDDQVPSIALIGDVELIRPTNREIDRLIWQSEQNPQGYRELVREFLARWGK
jgi:hypothetical protein